MLRTFLLVVWLTALSIDARAQSDAWIANAHQAPVGAKIIFAGDDENASVFVSLFCDLRFEVVTLPTVIEDQYGIDKYYYDVYCIKGENVEAYMGEESNNEASWFDWLFN